MAFDFRKMHGLGNDFVVIDNRGLNAAFPPERLRAIANRHTGIGCDQVIVLEPPENPDAAVFMRIYNPDGTEAEACGNATRCIAALLQEDGTCTIETIAGILTAQVEAGGLVTVDMGVPRLDWRDIPLAEDRDTLHTGIEYNLAEAVAVNVGNPHCVFFVSDAEKIPLAQIGPVYENDPLFPRRTNVEFAQIVGLGKIRLRVWERGAGVTMACGSAACATIVAAVRRGLSPRRSEIILDGGSLILEWREDNGHVLMTGPAADVFTGRWPE